MKDCNQCGKCCIKYGGDGLAVTKEEIDRWEENNPEIFQYVKNDEIWFDPETGLPLTRCPFLEAAPASDSHQPTLYTCSIYLNRPEDCRQYPSLISEMIRDECEMIEAKDLQNPKQAQIHLNLISGR